MAPPSASQDVGLLWKTGAEALRRGDSASALHAFRAMIAAGRDEAAVWTGVALAARNLGDTPAHLGALDQILARDPRDPRALMMKGDHYAAAGDVRSAGSFYTAVIKLAEANQNLSPDLAADVARARAANQSFADQYERHLRDHLATKGIDAPGAERNATALDLILGKKRIFLQEPRAFYFPGLPQIEFYDRGDFPWFDKLEAAWTAIRGELLDILEEDGAFTPYMEGGAADRPVFDEMGLLDDPGWSAFYLWKNGEIVTENAARCPKTLAALADAPLCRIPGQTPSVLFSLLRPGVRIPPHHGSMNTRLICHLPLIVPPDCGLRVGNESRTVEAGKGWLFDDTIEHEAWNNSGKLRVILLFDVWRPELTDVEREMVAATLEAIESFGGGRLAPDI